MESNLTPVHRLLMLRNQLGATQIFHPKANLERLRKKSTVNRDCIQKSLHGINLELRDRVIEDMLKDPEILSWPAKFESLKVEREATMNMAKKIYLRYMRNWEEYQKNPMFPQVIGEIVALVSQSLGVKIAVHLNLYCKTIVNLGTAKHMQLIQNAIKFDDIGCFALTELGHGSNVKGILTTAHYDKEYKEFVINTPRRALGMKFWIGGAAQTANMAAVWAQLYVDDKHYGVHCFVVPIRHKLTRAPMPGVTLGDCGPKIGLNGIDNGFIIFRDVRVPRDALLDRLSGVTEEGEFKAEIKNADKRFALALGSLSTTRISILAANSSRIRNILALGYRFSANRLQFGPPGENQPETPIFDYPLTQKRLTTLLASTMAYSYAYPKILDLWESSQAHIWDVKSTILPELHALISALKVHMTWFTHRLLNEVRQVCGGLGYSAFSRIGNHINDNDVTQTYEGDNNVLIQQTGKFLMDNYRAILGGKKVTAPSAQYIVLQLDEDAKAPADLTTNVESMIKVWEFKCNALIQVSAKQFQQNITAQNGDLFAAWNHSQLYGARDASFAYLVVYMARVFQERINSISCKNTQVVLHKLLELFLLDNILEDMVIFTEHNYFSGEQIRAMRARIQDLLDELKDETMGIIDAVADPEELIGSPFACKDGDMYKRFLAEVYTYDKCFERPTWWKDLKN